MSIIKKGFCCDFMNKPLERFTFDQLLREIKNAERENRPADLSYKLLPEFSFSEKEINTSLNFEGSTIQGAVYFDKCTVSGKINFSNCLIYTTLYFDNSQINGSLIVKNARIREVVNLISSKFKKNINFEGSKISGFLGLNKIWVGGNLNLKKVEVFDIDTPTGKIRGDIYLKKAKIVGSVVLKEAFFQGLGDFQETDIDGNFNLENAQFQEILILTGTSVEGETIAQGLKCKNLIAHLT